jgi:hypothetical protein
MHHTERDDIQHYFQLSATRPLSLEWLPAFVHHGYGHGQSWSHGLVYGRMAGENPLDLFRISENSVVCVYFHLSKLFQSWTMQASACYIHVPS